MNNRKTPSVSVDYGDAPAIKQVIVLRKDLNMRKGKMVAQGAHAAMAFLAKWIAEEGVLTEVQERWISTDMRKICVSVDSLEELTLVAQQCHTNGIDAHIVFDAGHTEFHGVPTVTALAVGPDYTSKIDAITGGLKLL